MSWLVVDGDAIGAGACKRWRQHNGISTLGIYSSCYHCSLSIQFLCEPLNLSVLEEILVVNDASETHLECGNRIIERHCARLPPDLVNTAMNTLSKQKRLSG
jgi:hypothetical protein